MAYSFVTLHALYLLSKTEIDKALPLLSLTQTQSLLLPHLARMLGQSRAQAFRRMREYLTLCGPPRCREQEEQLLAWSIVAAPPGLHVVTTNLWPLILDALSKPIPFSGLQVSHPQNGNGKFQP